MSVTKHKIFKLKVDSENNFGIDATTEKVINDFLAEPNYVYINHSITTLTEDEDVIGAVRTFCRFIAISIIYKDLNASNLNLNEVSEKAKDIVHKEIKEGDDIPEPQIETRLDKEIKEMRKNIEKANKKPSIRR